MKSDSPSNTDNLSKDIGFCAMLSETPNLKNLIIMICWWSFTSSGYYLVGFYIKYFKGSLYVNSFLFAFAGFLGVSTFGFLIQYFSNKKLLSLSFFLTFLGSLGFTLTKSYAELVPIWILIMVYSLSILFTLCYYTNWVLFEPSYRTRIFSICNIIARSFTMLSPMAVELMDNPLLVVCVLALIMTFVSKQIS